MREFRTLGSARGPPARAVPTAIGAFYRSRLTTVTRRLDQHLLRWAMQKFKQLPGKNLRAWAWLDAARQHRPTLLAHWHLVGRTERRLVGAR